jgi:hypothetical protein
MYILVMSWDSQFVALASPDVLITTTQTSCTAQRLNFSFADVICRFHVVHAAAQHDMCLPYEAEQY